MVASPCRALQVAEWTTARIFVLRGRGGRSGATGRPASVGAPGDRGMRSPVARHSVGSATMEIPHRIGRVAARGKAFLLLVACACGSVPTGTPAGSGATQDPSSPVSYVDAANG